MGKFPNEILHNMTSAEIMQFMAFDQLKSADYREKIRSESMSQEERDNAIMRLLGGA